MENSLYALLGFVEAAEKHIKDGGQIEGLTNIDLPHLKKSLTDSIGSFDVDKDAKSLKLGSLVFNQYAKEKEKPQKRNVVEELGQIFNVDFENSISEEKEVKLKIDDLLEGYETEFVEEETIVLEEKNEISQEEKVEKQISDVTSKEDSLIETQLEEVTPVEEENKEEVQTETEEVTLSEEEHETKEEIVETKEETPLAEIDFEAVINDIIGIKSDAGDNVYFGEIFHSVKKPEPNPVVAKIEEDADIFVETTVETLSEIVEENIGTFDLKKEKEEIKVEVKHEDTIVVNKEKLLEDTREVLIDIVKENIGTFEVVEEDFEENQKVVDEIKNAFDSLKETSIDEESEKIIFEEEENDFGLDENDEILKAIRKAAGFEDGEVVVENEPVFQPAPDELDSLFEEVEANESNVPQEEMIVEPMSQEDLLKSLSGLINYGQFDDIVEPEEEVVEEPQREVQYIFNPLVDEERYILADEQNENVEENIEDENSEETTKEEVNEEIETEAEGEIEEAEEGESEVEEENTEETLNFESYYITSEELALHFIENPGLDVIFDGDDVVYSSYKEEKEVESEDELADEIDEVLTELAQEVEEFSEEDGETNETSKEEELVTEEAQEDKIEEVVDENEKYVDDLLSNYEFTNNKVEEILDAKEEVYKVISKMYPYLNYAFIKSAYDLKDSISDEYKEGENVIILHRAAYKELEDLRKYAEVMMNHNYQVNVDENQMIVDTLKSYKNTDGLILNSIFEVANQVNLINGEYEGYCVLLSE